MPCRNGDLHSVTPSGCASGQAHSPARPPVSRRQCAGQPGHPAEALAHDFLRFAQANPKPCPVLAVSEPGDPHFPTLGAISTSAPTCRATGSGAMANWSRNRPTSRDVWRDDLVSFAIGCSFSFEEALIEDGIEVRHIACGSNVPMYRTDIPWCRPGVFHGPLVVSMRPLRPADAIRAVQITSRFPSVHGAPVHLGLPERSASPTSASRTTATRCRSVPDELPVFWACGVTPQAVIAAVRPEFCITHAPGSMLITDLRNTKLAAL